MHYLWLGRFTLGVDGGLMAATAGAGERKEDKYLIRLSV